MTCVALVYAPGLGGGFVFDDYPNLVENTALHVTSLRWNDWIAAAFSSSASGLQRPLAMASFAINHYFSGLSPWPMKVTNVGIHAMNAVLVFLLMKPLLLSTFQDKSAAPVRAFAAFVSAAWALHPINLMAVLFVVQRMESLSHTFVFLGLIFYIHGRQRQLRGEQGWRWVFLGLVPCTLIGLMAKESAVLLPLYAFCIEACLFHFVIAGKPDRRLALCFLFGLWLPAVMGTLWLLPIFLTPDAYATRNFTLGDRLLTEPRVVLDYLHWSVLPDIGQMSLYHDDFPPSRGLFAPLSTALSMLTALGLLTLAWLARNRRPLSCLGLLWFFAAQLLTATFIPFELMFEHRNYFASLGICLVLADLLLLAPTGAGPRKIGAILAVGFVLFFAGMTMLRAHEWDNPVRFAYSEAAKHPASPRATYELARVLVILSNYQAESPYTPEAFKALETARDVPGGNILADQAALLLGARSGIPLSDVWWLDMQDNLRRKPLGPQPIAALGSITHCAINRRCLFPDEQMMQTYAAALSQGANAEVLHIYGDYMLNVQGDPTSALRLWQEASSLQPGVIQYRNSLCRLLIALGRYEPARQQIEQIKRLGRFGSTGAMVQQLERTLAARQLQLSPRPRTGK